MLKTTRMECHTCQWTVAMGFLERESEEQASLLLVIRERRRKMTWAMLVPRKEAELPWIAKRAARFIDQLGHNRVTLRCDKEPAIEVLARKIGQARQEGSQTVPDRLPLGERKFKGMIERAVELVASQARTLIAALENPVRRKEIVLAAEAARPKGQHTHPGIRREDSVHARQPSQQEGESGNRDSVPECSWGC